MDAWGGKGVEGGVKCATLSNLVVSRHGTLSAAVKKKKKRKCCVKGIKESIWAILQRTAFYDPPHARIKNEGKRATCGGLPR